MFAKKIAAIGLAAVLAVGLAACDPPKDPGNPKTGGKPKSMTVWNDGEHIIGIRSSQRTIHAIEPSESCSWTLMYDIPNGKVVVVAKGGVKSARRGVKLAGPGTIRYRDPKSGKMVTTKNRPTSFYSEGCNLWRSS